jgi:hypothetical protein
MSVARGGLPLAHVPASGIRFAGKDMLSVARKNKHGESGFLCELLHQARDASLSF